MGYQPRPMVRGEGRPVLGFVDNELLFLTISLVFAWSCAQLLPLRNPRAMYAIQVVSYALGRLTTQLGVPWLSVVGLLFFHGVVPYLCWEAPRYQRATCAIMLILLTLLCESACTAIFVAAEKPLSTGQWRTSELLSIIRLAYVAAMVTGALILQRITRRLFGAKEERSLHWYVAFFVFQVMTSVANFYLQLYSESPLTHVHTEFVVLAVCLAADVAAFYSMARGADAERERARAALLEERLEGYLEGSRGALLAAGEAARLRHDRANHLRVVRGLAASGESGRALAYVRQLRDGL